ncbi:MAG: hypothetical protein IKA44_05305 [Clostridia bacterium]|nr:hypothetical protein [Clostridia bacterium]
MKKLIILTLTLILTLALAVIPASAETNPDPSVTVTVSVGGNLKLTAVSVPLTDCDGDNTLTVNDALIEAHILHAPGGESAYGYADTEYGRSLTKLWGDESGAYGYCVNNASAMSLLDPVKAGDIVTAYVYKDQTAWSDAYSYFNISAKTFEDSGSLTLTLSYNTLDENWQTVTNPLEGAFITVDGTRTEIITDKDGKATLSVKSPGTYVISAECDSMTLVPPVCVVTVNAKPMNPLIIVILVGAVVGCISGAVINAVKKRKNA